MLAPIALFVYNRPDHTQKTLWALSKNHLANQSSLYIFSDGPKANEQDSNLEKIKKVREVIKSQKWCGKVQIIESKKNKGLANSIISGINQVFQEHKSIIVLEDDLETSSSFLTYMNKALNKYVNENKVFQISGFNFFSNKEDQNKEAYFLPLTTTWGWATWKSKWEKIDFECADYVDLVENKNLAFRFNMNGSYGYSNMLIRQMKTNGRFDSWGIRYYWSVFKFNGLILYPDYSLVTNFGWDGTGKHNDSYSLFPVQDWDKNYHVERYPDVIEMDSIRYNRIQKETKKQLSLKNRIISKIKRTLKIN